MGVLVKNLGKQFVTPAVTHPCTPGLLGRTNPSAAGAQGRGSAITPGSDGRAASAEGEKVSWPPSWGTWGSPGPPCGSLPLPDTGGTWRWMHAGRAVEGIWEKVMSMGGWMDMVIE